MNKLKYNYIQVKKDNLCSKNTMGVEIEIDELQRKKTKQYLKKNYHIFQRLSNEKKRI